MTLRDWAVAAWAKPGVTEACLELQDRHGQCVALLLWRLWAQGPADQAIEAARPFEHEVLRPLRAARRAVADGDLKAKIRAAELAAEFELLDGLQALTPPDDVTAPADPKTALIALMAAWNQAGGEVASPAARLAAAAGLC